MITQYLLLATQTVYVQEVTGIQYVERMGSHMSLLVLLAAQVHQVLGKTQYVDTMPCLFFNSINMAVLGQL